MEGMECEISTLLSLQQPAESSCFHRVKSSLGRAVSEGERWPQERSGKVPGHYSPAHQACCPLQASIQHDEGENLKVTPCCWTTQHIYPPSWALKRAVSLTVQVHISWSCYRKQWGGSSLSCSWLSLKVPLS